MNPETGRLFLHLFSVVAALLNATPAKATDSNLHEISSSHREDGNPDIYPWLAVGKLYNSVGGACSGVLIAQNQVLTAAHCLFNGRTQRFLPAASIHFLLGYRQGQYRYHVRVTEYQVGPGFEARQPRQSIGADWAILTLTETVATEVKPLALAPDLLPGGTKVMLGGYPQDRAHALTVDRNCELQERIDNGRLLVHTCRGIHGYSGAPLIVTTVEGTFEIAGIHVATVRRQQATTMIAIPAQTILQSRAPAH